MRAAWLLPVCAVVACAPSDPRPSDPPARAPATPAPPVAPPTPSPTPPSLPGIELVEVSGDGFAPVTEPVRVVVSPTALSVDGRQLVALTDGRVARKDLRGEDDQAEVPALVRELAEHPTARLVIAIDAHLTTEALHHVLRSMQYGGTKRTAVVVARTTSALVGAPLVVPWLPRGTTKPAMPDRHAIDRNIDEQAVVVALPGESTADVTSRSPAADLAKQIGSASTGPNPQLGLFVRVARDHMWLSSTAAPRQTIDRVDDAGIARLAAALATIAGQRPNAVDQPALLEVRGEVPIATTLRVLGALRQHFPNVKLRPQRRA